MVFFFRAISHKENFSCEKSEMIKCHVIDTGDRRKEAIFERVTGRSLRKENKGLQYRNRIEKKQNRTK